MIRLADGKFLIQDPSELPDLSSAKELFLDVETNNEDLPCKEGKSKDNSMPFHGDRICGIAVTVDETPVHWYIPIRHREEKWNIPLEPVQKWLKETIETIPEWINHNINFDAHFVTREGVQIKNRIVDTLTLSKLIDSDRWEHGLKPLCQDWCDLDMDEEKRLKAELKGRKTNDYSMIPADRLGLYAMEDVFGNRKLYRYLQEKRTEDIKNVWETEILFTPILYDIEEFGMQVNELNIKIELVKSIQKSIILETEISQLTGRELNVNSSQQIFDLLVNFYGLPVVAWTEKGGASFDKEAMLQYKTLPEVIMNPEISRVITLLCDAVEEAHFRGLYLEPFSRLAVDGILHPSYNQCVRTGRLSCSNPNAQQLNHRAKELIIPRPGHGIMSFDYSQIEFRLIVHYIKDEAAIQAYLENPDTDFHQWVADICHIQRSPAKSMNFMMAFGGGEKKAVSQLQANEDIVNEMLKKVEEWEKNPTDFEGMKLADRKTAFKIFCEDHAKKVYQDYHERLPNLKRVSKQASDCIARRGFVFNAYGRRRHLPMKAKRKGFNAVIQSCASDIMKERKVALAPRYNSWTRELGINTFALVHDESAEDAPLEICKDEKIQKRMIEIFEDTNIKFRVPIRMKCGASEKTWADAAS